LNELALKEGSFGIRKGAEEGFWKARPGREERRKIFGTLTVGREMVKW